MMKNQLNYKVIAIAISSALLLDGCATTAETSTSAGSTTTGVLAGGIAGAAMGVGCDKLTGGKATGACVAAGMAVGAAVGAWAAQLDQETADAVPKMDCASVKREMSYPSKASKPRAMLKLVDQASHVVKPGEELKLPYEMSLATPGEKGKEQEITFKIEKTSAEAVGVESGKPITKECGGDYPIPLSIKTDKTDKGAYHSTIKLINVGDNNNQIEGGILTFCYTVANDGIDQCVKTQPVTPKAGKKGKKKSNI
jgi:hypothetical protein